MKDLNLLKKANKQQKKMITWMRVERFAKKMVEKHQSKMLAYMNEYESDNGDLFNFDLRMEETKTKEA